MSRLLVTNNDLNTFIREHPVSGVYFSGPNCGVCEALKPKLFELLGQRFPRLILGEVNCDASRELAAQQMVFTIPTLIVYLDGREGLRKSRSFSLAELAAELERPYGIFTKD